MTPETLLAAIDQALAFDFEAVGPKQVQRALSQETLSLADLGALLSKAALSYLEPMAQKARVLTRRHFGLNVALFTPLYLANFCVNQCLYCGYNAHNKVLRGALTLEEIAKELLAIKNEGFTDVLLLTGESRLKSSPAYVTAAVKLAAESFASVGLEVYPLKTPEYQKVQKAGADYVCVYQETYDPIVYAKAHLLGPKKDYLWRLMALERALEAGVRGVGLGALLGLANFRRDVLALGAHGQYLRSIYPEAEIAYSTPRLRPVPGAREPFGEVSDAELTQIILALRLFSPTFGLTLSTRERPYLRDHLMGLGVTRLSAGVRTSVGGRAGQVAGEEQFIKADERRLSEVEAAIKAKGLQPVFTDYARL
ncbi:MAG: 2-iminoacetate synthase ThiH [Deltaproteobacteria bacterium]|jgi:2-iminoacetate synthase|nr:2-iminoacetate synthase ThiH [Deltaproteobacteria bacterium]